MPMHEHLGGVYLLTLSNYYYFGMSSYLTQRFNYHISDLKSNIHTNPRLQNLYNSIKQLPTFEIIKMCDDPERSILEYDLIIKHRSDPNCLNIMIPKCPYDSSSSSISIDRRNQVQGVNASCLNKSNPFGSLGNI